MNTPVRVKLKNFTIANDKPFVFIGGPDSLESLAHALKMAKAIKDICAALGIP